MYGIWCERPMPTEIEQTLADVAVIGAGPVSSAAFKENAARVNAIIASATSRFDLAFMQGVPNLRVISRTGIGVDNIDLEAATTQGVAICNTPDVPTISTAEHAISLMMALAKQLKPVEAALRQGERKDFFNQHRAIVLSGARLGVVGLGRIGGHAARLGLGLGMIVAGYDAYAPSGRYAELSVERMDSLEALLRVSDVVTLHLPATPETYHLMNAERLAQMKPGAYLINTARGTLVDEVALLDALERGHLAGVGLDVFDPEPPDPVNPLLHRHDVIATPHVAGITVTSRQQFWVDAVGQALQVLRRERPANLVNGDVWGKA